MKKPTPSFDQPIIGIEVHVELATKSKMFCGCSADHFARVPNTLTCPVCLGLPGALPVANHQAIIDTIKIGLGLGAQIQTHSKFDRKHYFYPDLPKGYQISQYDEPLCLGGQVDTSFGPVALTRVHLEEDTGKLQHTHLDGAKVSLVDFNRSGVPLVEIVSQPVIHSSVQAKEYAKNLARTIRFLGVSDADMEKGSMRLEANISWGFDLGYKVEVKNINSFNFLAKAIDYELARQRQLLERGITPDQETRGFNETKNETVSQRSKEDAKDYRYFPDPDLPPIELTQTEIEAIAAKLPKLPEQYFNDFTQSFGLKPDYATILTDNPILADFTQNLLQQAKKKGIDPVKAAGIVVNSKLDPNKTTPQAIITKLEAENNKISDSSTLEAWVDQAITANPQAVTDFHQGKQASIQFLMGQVMKLARGQADAQAVIKLLQTRLHTKK